MPSTARRRLGALVSGVTILCVAGTLSPTLPAAHAAAPVATADSLTIRADSLRVLDVLGNDTDADGDDLEICRVEDVPDELLVMEGGSERDESTEVLGIVGLTPGSYTFTYYACDLETLSPATVTVTVKPARKLTFKVRVTKLPEQPGKVAIRNLGQLGLRVMWGSWEERRPDGAVRVRPGQRQVISVRRRSIKWLAVSPRTGRSDVGSVRGIKLPKGVKELPPGAPSPEDLGKASRPSLRWAR